MRDNIHILIVDDSEIIKKTLTKILTKHYQSTQVNISLTFASNGVEALSKITTVKDFDVVLLDINMPKMGGLEVLEFMVQKKISIPTIVMTTKAGKADKSNIVKALSLGADDYVHKENLKDSVNRIHNILS